MLKNSVHSVEAQLTFRTSACFITTVAGVDHFRGIIQEKHVDCSDLMVGTLAENPDGNITHKSHLLSFPVYHWKRE